jgi:CRISPR-associated endonuclease/helicase Cas3
VAEPQEMLPWIRGWGAEVEVLAPEGLRERLVHEVQRMARMYDLEFGESLPLYQQLWAKVHKKTGEIHPLFCHMIDVGQVARVIWREVLTSSFRAHIAEALELEEPEAERLIVFWVSLHDLGKASPGFQRKYEMAETELKKAGLPFQRIFSRERFYHGTASADLLPALLTEKTDLPRRWARGISRAVGGHHGGWPIAEELQALKSYHLGAEEWDQVREELIDVLMDIFSPPSIENAHVPRKIRNTLFTLLSGLTSVADWIGSMETYFPFTAPPIDIDRYAERAKRQAYEALAALNWLEWQPPQQARTFCELFEVDSPRPMQSEVVELAERLDQPALVIIEAPTGIGKTEAALYLADHWARVLCQHGMYVAMPTMATSNQMHDRVNEMLTRRYPDMIITPLLVHSQARWTQMCPPQDINIADEEIEDTAQAIEAMSWFLPSKRSLLAPFGVGTVDQTFLSVLQTRHFFVRLFGLSHKTLIFDEVHAYDTYMSTLFQRLLGWLRAVDTSVVILSATLPAQTREELVRAYVGDDIEVPPAPYPAVTWAMNDRIGVIGMPEGNKPESSERTVALNWLDRDPMMLAERLQEALSEGGCAAVICNTVRRSQEVYRVLRENKIVADENLILFHARFPFGWRKKIEARVLNQFGKRGSRPSKAIVVATQVIEQSLDLDFDLMISDLAPVDLLIQRAGRLHRHAGRERPNPLSEPRFWITHPDIKNGTLDFGNDKWVYEPYVLLRSYLALQGRAQWELPIETRDLIEAVYGPDEPAAGDFAYLLPEARHKMRSRNTKEGDIARQKLVLQPGSERLLKQSNAGLQEGAPEIHQAFQALTRLGQPSVSVVCLHQIDGRLNTEPDGSGAWIKLSYRPDAVTTQALVDATVTISHRELRSYLINTHDKTSPSGWRRHSLLKNYYVLEFHQNRCSIEEIGYTSTLNPAMGLDITKEAA